MAAPLALQMRFRFGVQRRKNGFTLIELVVGMTVGIVLIVILFQVFGVAAAAWQKGENQADAYREARAAMQLMTRDLSNVCAQFPVSPIASPAPLPNAAGIAPTLVLDGYPSPDPARGEGDTNNEEVYFLTTIPNTGLSSLCAVGYFCQWLPDVANTATSSAASTSAPRAYSLFRQFLGSGSDSQPGLYDLLTASPKTSLSFMDVFVRSRPNSVAKPKTAIASEMGSYIWDLQFRIDTNLKAVRGAAQPPEDHGPALNPAAPLRSYSSKDSDERPPQLPPYIEIRFKALSAQGARQLEGNNSVTRSTWWPTAQPEPIYKNVILRSTQQFVARVPLQAAQVSVQTPLAGP